MHLAGAGRQVTVVDRRDNVGGLCGRIEDSGFSFDTGPTVLTMPDLLADCFNAVGEELTDWLDLRRLDPAYRAVYADGSQIDIRDSIDGTAAAIESACGASEAAGFRRFADYARELYDVQINTFIAANIDSPLSLLGPQLARLTAMGGFGSLAAKIGTFFADERTQRLFSFQALYAGVAPARARALYAVIAYMDAVNGVYFPTGGMHAIPTAMAAAAAKHGVQFQLGTEVTSIELSGSRATGVRLSGDERIDADAVVITADTDQARASLLGSARPHRPRTYSPSCLLLHMGVHGKNPYGAHHVIHFGEAWESTFDQLTRTGQLMSDPSILVTDPSETDSSLAPEGCQTLFVLAPTPNLSAKVDWEAVGDPYTEEIHDHLGQRGYDLSEVRVEHRVTPVDWQLQSLPMGTPFSLAHSVGQTGPFRPSNFPRKYDNVVFAGAGTTPGVGVPMVLVSGALSAQRITGARP